MKRLWPLAFLLGTPANSQTSQVLDTSDARIAAVQITPGEPVALNSPPDIVLDVLFPPAETLLAVTVGDIAAFQVTVPAAANGLFIKALRPAASTHMTVRTDAGIYDFSLSSAPVAHAPYVVRLHQASASVQLTDPASALLKASSREPGTYRVKGARQLRPHAIRDDGTRTYIQWTPEQAMPAVFALDGLGREEMVNGYVRGGWFTIDRVHRELVFRIDQAFATARRRSAGKRDVNGP